MLVLIPGVDVPYSVGSKCDMFLNDIVILGISKVIN